MKFYKKIISISTFLLFSMMVLAQTGSNSPYSRYGFGQLSDQTFANSKAMGGVAYGFRNGRQINAANPASYSAVDSLTFLFDMGMSLQNTNFKENGKQLNAKNSTVDYIAMQFRLTKGLGFTAGFIPYSTVGYNMNRSSIIPNSGNMYGETTYKTETFSGEGGLQQIFIGLGYNIWNNLSIGANFSYLYGDITHSVGVTYSNTNATNNLRSEQISVKDYKLDLGAQYTQRFKEKHEVTLGAVYSFGKDLNSDGYRFTETYNSSSVLQSQKVDTLSNVCGLPQTIGIGASYTYDKRLTVGIDYTYQQWEEVKFPTTVKDDQNNQFIIQKGHFCNRSKISAGVEYLPDPYKRNYLSRIRYRIGAHYSTPYTKIDGKEGAREYGVSFGFGLPIFRSKSMLNISGQYIKVSPKVSGMLEENSLRINIGLTFNESWFVKWKVN